MTRDDLADFLHRVGAQSLREYLGNPGRDEAIAALEQRVAWAVAHRNDPEHDEASDFLVRNAKALEAVLDEGEEAWWDRTATSPRVRKPDGAGESAWTERDTFATPVAPVAREAHPTIAPDVTLDAPLPEVTRKSLRRGRAMGEPSGGEALLPEAYDTPGGAQRGHGPAHEPTWVEEAPDPDETDPIGFVAVPLSDADRHRDERLAGAPAREAPHQGGATFHWHEVDEEEATDPVIPALTPPHAPIAPAAPPPVAAPAPRGGRWTSTVVLLLGVLALAAGLAALLLVLFQIGRRQGETMARQGWEEAHDPSPTTAEPVPAPAPEAAVEVRPAPSPGTAPAPRAAPSPGAAPGPAPAPEPAAAPSPVPEATPASLANTTWAGTGGTGPLTLYIEAHDGDRLRGRIVRVEGGLKQTTLITGTLDPETGALVLFGEGLSIAGTVEGRTARGTWAPDGTPRQWLLALQ